MNGIEATRQILLLCPHTRVMMLSAFESPEHIQDALQMGALGYVLKDTVGSELLDAVRAVYSGNQFFSQKIAGIAKKNLK
jgi:DNA-binding NarL/FixJ family response regulator